MLFSTQAQGLHLRNGETRSPERRVNARISPPTARRALPNIAINGRFLTQKTVGVQRFASETVKAMDRLLDGETYAGLRGRIEIVAPRAARDFPLVNIPVRRIGWLAGYAWEQIEFPLSACNQLLLNLCLLGPVVIQHQVVVAHDAMVRAMPENFSRQFRTAYNFLVPRLLRADLAVTVSDFSRREIGKYYGLDVSRMPVCYEGADHITAVPSDERILDRLLLRGQSYFLGVGINNRNKNIENILAVFAQARLADTLLVVTGSPDARVHDYFVHLNSANARAAGHVSDGELRALYENALGLVFPSRYEGFGLPPIEAMQCGCPVIVSDQPALLESGGDAVLSCGVDDVASLAQSMRTLQSDTALRARLKAAGIERARFYTWERTARILLDCCIEVEARGIA
jgi:glycosyltransferase involved in cell wall biosynthesis